jgi:hypothetical protein
MPFDPQSYGPGIAAILNLDGSGGQRLIPLVASGSARIAKARAHIQPDVAAQAPHPAGVLAGLWTYCSCFDEAHAVAQDDASVEGSYWHGILHRQEPDAWNSGYWFRRVRSHAVFSPLAEAACEIAERNPGSGFRISQTWDPNAFIDYCESARQKPGSLQEAVALEIQRVEWQLLFDYCCCHSQGTK